jgi:asparagine synthase (glutamine-hydrolysing)
VAQLESQGARSLLHCSGRPWIVGWWADDELVTASEGDNQVAVLGRTTADHNVLQRGLSRIRTRADLSGLASEISGCFHLISSLAGQVRAQGTLAGVYRLYYTTVAGVTVAADRPGWLVQWTGAQLDQDLLALRLLIPYGPPWPLSNRCLWRGVHAVPPGHYLALDRDGAGRMVRWWSPPEPELSRAEGAGRVRAALADSIRSRVDSSGSRPLSFDLSGGMDSTSLCYLAGHIGVRFSTIHYAFSDPSNPDTAWAERARQNLPSARHEVFPTRALPGYFVDAPPGPAELDLEGPTSLVHRSVVEHLAGLVAESGADRHLQGHGSDELFTPDLSVLYALVRRHPWRRLRSLQARRARGRLPLATALAHFRGQGSYRSWLLRAAARLGSGEELRQDGGWEAPPRSPEWATPEAVAHARNCLIEAAEADPEPLGSSPSHHALLRGVQTGGLLVRQSSVIGERLGVSFEAPYVDDRVLEAAMSIRLEERIVAQVNKPVLAAAMRDVVPPGALDRKDKSNGDRELYDGLRRSRQRLEEVWADPALARLGLVNAETLRAVVLGLQTNVDRLAPLGPTWSCEMWLRAVLAAGHLSAVQRVREPLATV